MKSIPLLLVITFATAASAQQFSGTYRDCMTHASSQTAITMCAVEEAKSVEAELNKKYSKALTLAADHTPEAVNKIKTAQNVWDRYVTAYLDAMFPLENKQVEYGTSYVSEGAILRVKLAQRQIAAIDDLIAQFTPK